MDQPKVERMLRLMKYMSGNVNYSVEELAEKLDMSYRTIYRYIDTFKNAGFVVSKLYGNIYKLGKMPRNALDIDKLIYFSEEEAYLVNSLIDNLSPTNSLKSNLKDKLSAIYGCTSIADYVDRRSNAAHVESLGEAAKNKKKVLLKNYESGNSQTIRDRYIEPFGFTTDCIDVWGYDLEDGQNKLFKISRIGEVEVLEQDWTEEASHCKKGLDVFRMNGQKAVRVKLQLSVRAKNLLLEEYPLAERDLVRDGNNWVLDTEVYDFAGVCRFFCGLAAEVKIIDSPEFREYVRGYVKENLGKV
jgi:predicted DNA-binding transcriptional regulator YafY